MKRRAAHIFAVCIFIITGLGCLVAWGFLAHKSAQYREEISVISGEIADVERKDAHYSSIEGSLRVAKDDAAALASRFIQEENVPRFIAELEALAREKNVVASIDSINLDERPADPKGVARTLRVRMHGSGDWSDAVAFVSAVDALPRIARIESLSLLGGEQGWQINLDLLQYIAD